MIKVELLPGVHLRRQTILVSKSSRDTVVDPALWAHDEQLEWGGELDRSVLEVHTVD